MKYESKTGRKWGQLWNLIRSVAGKGGNVTAEKLERWMTRKQASQNLRAMVYAGEASEVVRPGIGCRAKPGVYRIKP